MSKGYYCRRCGLYWLDGPYDYKGLCGLCFAAIEKEKEKRKQQNLDKYIQIKKGSEKKKWN